MSASDSSLLSQSLSLSNAIAASSNANASSISALVTTSVGMTSAPALVGREPSVKASR
eukprot:CAMPEP_0115859694 /NCGR_PEP_ID=MMETSP0287-20121206/16748_1 /TAXON_ID=412157 /ORGANISM="Chrysochromulina rotalis, Strain UIO044" /LENGTH=57 /DNA_ID=CAMNT_0003314003 /DNA_START=951 /DNA_END=1121 /DNA_ORIENTATION=+